jgi:excisionase family DNA binding protein
MASERQLSVRDAAEQLGVSPAAVRLRIGGGDLPAVKLGRDWRIDERDVQRLRRRRDRPGRPLSPSMAWAVLLLASGDQEAAGRLAVAPRYRARARQWLREHPLVECTDRLRERARREVFEVHPSELAQLRDRPDVLLTGVSVADAVGLVGEAAGVEFYAGFGQRGAIMDEHGLVPGEGDVTVRWVPDDVWTELDVSAPVAPRAVVLIDLLESDDPRARREAARALAL